jgi:hypothetical protein
MSRQKQAVVLQLARDREVEAIKLRRTGATYAEIAAALGYKEHTGARDAVQRGMRKALQEPADELRELEAARLDAAQAAIWPDVMLGETKAVLSLVRIMERRAKLLGLDQPIRVQADVTVFEGGSELDAEVQRLAEFLAGNGNSDSGSIEDALAIEIGEA